MVKEMRSSASTHGLTPLKVYPSPDVTIALKTTNPIIPKVALSTKTCVSRIRETPTRSG